MAYRGNISGITKKNKNYRTVLFTTPQMQLVVMNLKKGEEIGTETHEGTTQFIRVEKGRGRAIIDGQKYGLQAGTGLVIPPGSEHNIIASKKQPLLLYTLYSPPEHKPGLVQKMKV